MANRPLTTIDWTGFGLIPLNGCEFWHQYGYGQSDSTICYDYSGNDRHISCASVGAPVLTVNVLNGQPGWYFSGTSNYLGYTGAVTVKHLFVLASADEATFGAFRGLFTGASSNSILVGNSGTTKMFDLSADFTSTYRKNDTVYAHADQQAAMSGNFALYEVQIPGGVNLSAIQVGQQYADTTRRWKGYWMEQAGFSRVLNYEERRQVLLHFNLRFGTDDLGVPLYFPSKDIVPEVEGSGGSVRVFNRFNDVPKNWDDITETAVFEDKGVDFNELADDVPQRWEYRYLNVPKGQKTLFDLFNDRARRAKAFYFKDPEDLVWSNVHVETYDRGHDEHKRWRHAVGFGLVGYDSAAVYEAPPAPPDTTPPASITDLAASAIGGTVTLDWTPPTDA